jgi:hypothetical protein
MPLIKSDTQAATEDNFHELRHGKTFKKTAKKYGKTKARKQMVAIALKTKRDAAKKKTRRKRG